MSDSGEIKPSDGRNDKPPSRYWEAARKELWFDLKFSHYVEIILTAALVGIAYFQYTVYNRQAKIMETQTRILKIDKRPWIKSTITITEPLRFSDWNNQKGISAVLHFELKNYGESPAVNVRIGAEIAQHPGNTKRFELSAPQQKTCERARNDAVQNSIGGIAIFPSDSAAIEQGNGLSGIYKADEAVLFAIAGCVVYTFAETERGETGFRMMLGRIAGDHIVGLPFVDGPPEPYKQPISPELLAKGYPATPPNVGLLQAGDFVFRPEDEGNYAK